MVATFLFQNWFQLILTPFCFRSKKVHSLQGWGFWKEAKSKQNFVLFLMVIVAKRIELPILLQTPFSMSRPKREELFFYSSCLRLAWKVKVSKKKVWAMSRRVRRAFERRFWPTWAKVTLEKLKSRVFAPNFDLQTLKNSFLELRASKNSADNC